MKKILHIQVIPKLSGVQKISLDILKNLPDLEYEKWILFSDHSDIGNREECEKAFESAGVKVIYSNKMYRSIGLKDFAAIYEIYKLCKHERFDIVHTHSTKPGIIGRIAATCAQVPLIVHTVHGLAFHHFTNFPKWHFYWICEMFASLFCHKIVLVNKYYEKYFKWIKKKTCTIPNGIDFNLLPKVNKQCNDIPHILFVGRLDTQKDPVTLLKAAKIVIERNNNIKFTLVGDGEKKKECLDYIAKNRINDNVLLTGWQTDVAKYYSTHDIFYASSIYESFGLMFVEAGYYNLPVVATNVEGIPEVIEDGVTGLLSPPRNPEKIANNILFLIDNPQQRIEMGKAAYKRVTTLFPAKKMIKQYLEIYKNA